MIPKAFVSFRQRYRQYKDVYKQHLRQPNKETIMNQLRHLEDDLDITNILVAREHAKLEVQCVNC